MHKIKFFMERKKKKKKKYIHEGGKLTAASGSVAVAWNG